MDDSTLERLVNSSTEDPALVKEVRQVASGTDRLQVPSELVSGDREMSDSNAFDLIRSLSIPQRIKVALFGNRVSRAILIRDTMRQIPFFVLENARLTEDEVHDFARNTNLDESVLRAIAHRSEWMKSYPIKVAICSNPRTPIDVSLKWIRFLQPKDLRQLGRSKNVPQVIAGQCRKLVERQARDRKGPQ